jgi:transposase InsO family protein
LGLTGPVPRRVDGDVKAGLLDLVASAVEAGWSLRRTCGLLEVNHSRVISWLARVDAGVGLNNATPGPTQAPHALLDWERDAILAVYDAWHGVDRSYRKLAHRGSREDRVHASESTFWRVLTAEGLVLPRPAREPVARKPWPDWVEYRPCQVWGHDFTHFTRARRVAIAVLDLVSRYWITTLVSGEETSEQVTAAYTLALEDQGLLGEAERRMIAPNSDEQLPILLAVSDNGPQMTSGTTREWLALHSLAWHTGRPGTPTDQAHIETLFGHVKTEWPELEAATDPAVLDRELERVRFEYNTVRLHAGIGYVTPDDEHHGRGAILRKQRAEGLRAARAARLAYWRQQQTDN